MSFFACQIVCVFIVLIYAMIFSFHFVFLEVPMKPKHQSSNCIYCYCDRNNIVMFGLINEVVQPSAN